MTSMTLFYELIQVAFGNRVVLSRTPSETEWHDLYKMCQKQSVVGIAFEALEHLSEQRQKPPLDLLYQWIGDAEQIKQQNLRVNKRCVEISQMFAEAGFNTCILKGQGNARMYDVRSLMADGGGLKDEMERLSRFRQPGDIDVWVDVDGRCKKEDVRNKVDQFVHSRFPRVKGGRMHIEFPVFDDVAVEVHYIPSIMYAPKHDRRLQTFFREKAEEQFCNKVTLEGAEGICAVPTVEFNLVQQLSHMMSHVMGEGIGLRQFIDYYYVLKTVHGSRFMVQGWDDELREMGLLKFAQGVMWIEKELLGLEDKYLIVEPSEKIGRAIQRTIEDGGNFGHHSSLNSLRHQSLIGRAIGGAKQSLCAIRYFPTEATWKLIRKVI